MRKFLIISVLIGGLTHGQKNSQSEYLTDILRNSDSGVNKNAIESVPRRLSYQGLLTKANGQAVGAGSYQVTFKLYRELIGGTAFWEETQNIDISDGVINATLGVVNQINNVPSSSYLEIMVNETTLSPRQEMTSVFYSVVSDTAKYSQAGNYMDLDNRPDLSIYAKEDTLSTYVKNSSLDTVAFTGSYNDLSDLPDFSEIINFDTLGYYVMSDSLSSYVLTSELASVAISNSYNDLSGLPDLGQYATFDTLGNFVLTDSIGTIAKQNSNNVDITGGSIFGVSDIAIADGGTGASDNSTARSNLGLEIGVDIQAFDADLADLADGLLTGNKVEYLENVTSDVQAQIDSIGIKSLEDLGITADSTELNYVDGVTSNIQDQLDAKQSLNANLSTLAELEQNHDHFIVSDGTSWVTKEGSNARTSLGLGSISTQDSDNVLITGGSVTGIDDIGVADGGTGASDISTARTNLGLEIGVDIQGYDADLTDLSDGTLSASKIEFLQGVTSDVQVQLDSKGSGTVSTLTDLGVTATATELNYVDGVSSNIQDQLDSKVDNNVNLTTLSGLGHADGNFLVSDGSTWTVESGSDARTSLGLGSIATQAANNVTISGGAITGVTDISVADGGTGASDIATARTNLGLELGVDVQAYDADLADLADGKLSSTRIEYGEYVITTEGTSGQIWTSDGDGRGTWGSTTALSGAASSIDTEDLTASRAVISNASGKIAVSDVTTTELGYLDGVTSNLQTQFDNKQNKDTDLSDISGFSHSDGNFLVSDGSSWTVESGSDARTSLGLGSIATQAANNVTISGGAITGVTDIAVADGGTGASDIASARTNLGLDIGVDVQAYDADLADLADGELSASKVQYAITTEGTSGQVWTSDGSGAGAWVTSSAATSINGLSDALVEDTGSMYIGNDPSTSTDGANYNIAVGTTALDAVTTGYSNTAIGYNALTENLSANRNTAVGSNALKSNTTGITNVAVGSSALERNTTANRNTAVGHASSYLLNSGQNNVSLGYESSKNMTSANNNVIIGSGANPSADTGTSNQVVIGYGVTGVANNSITLGNSDVTAVYMAQDEGATAYGAIFKGSTSIQTPLIEYTDGDDALTIADGGDLTTSGNLSVGGSNNELRFYEGSNYVGFEAPSLSADQVWSLPTADGSANQVLKTDGSGALAWTDVSATIVTVSDNENTSETNALVFTSGGDVDGGSMGLESDGDATYNPSTGVIGSTGFSGATVLASTSVDITGSAGLILENDEKITNSIDGTVLINGVVAGGTGSAAGVFASNGDNDITIKTGNSNTGTITITDGANENISIAPNGTGKTDFNDSPLTGYGADLQTESGTSKTLAAADNGTIIVCSSNSAVTITVPASLPTGFNCMIIQSGSGQVSLSASSTTLNNRNGTKTAGQHAIMTVVHLGSDAFVVSGDVTS